MRNMFYKLHTNRWKFGTKHLVDNDFCESVEIYVKHLDMGLTSTEDGRKCFKYVLGDIFSYMVASKSLITPPKWVIGI